MEKCKEVIAYPNPFNEQIIFELSEPPEGYILVTIATPKGKVFYHQTHQLEKDNTILQLNVSSLSLSPGLYIITLQSPQFGKKLFKLLKI